MSDIEKIDILNRQAYVDQIKRILSTLSQNKKNCSFALNGEWGAGKTFVLDMLERDIKDNYLVIRYNAWENDFYEEPLIAILYTFANKLNELQKNENIVKGLKKEILSKIANGFLDIIGQISKNKFGVDIVELGRKGRKEAQKFQKHLKELEKEESIDVSFDQNSNLQEIKKQIAKGLKGLAKECPIVVMVDELDRCLPEYAIKVLERLHHVFDGVKNLQVILSIDKEQLSNAVAQIYNLSSIEKDPQKVAKNARSYMDYINSYFKKFFSFEIYLNEGHLNDEKFKERIAEYENQFNPNSKIIKGHVNQFLEMIFKDFNIREKINLIEKADLIHKLIVADDVKLDISYMYMEMLLTLKQEPKIKRYVPLAHSPDDFMKIVNYNDYFRLLCHNMSQNMNSLNGRVRQSMLGNEYFFELKDLWCYLWFALLMPLDNHSIWRIENCPDFQEYNEHFTKYKDLLKAMR